MKKIQAVHTRLSERFQKLLPKGEPKWIRVYKSKEEFYDPYTIVYSKLTYRCKYEGQYISGTMHPYTTASEFRTTSHNEQEFQAVDRPTYGHLGKKIKFSDLTPELQKEIVEEYADLWNLSVKDAIAVYLENHPKGEK